MEQIIQDKKTQKRSKKEQIAAKGRKKYEQKLEVVVKDVKVTSEQVKLLNNIYLLTMINNLDKAVKYNTHQSLWDYFGNTFLNEKKALRDSKPSKKLELNDLANVSSTYPFIMKNGLLVVKRKLSTHRFNCICTNNRYTGFANTSSLLRHIRYNACFKAYLQQGEMLNYRLLYGIKINRLINIILNKFRIRDTYTIKNQLFGIIYDYNECFKVKKNCLYFKNGVCTLSEHYDQEKKSDKATKACKVYH